MLLSQPFFAISSIIETLEALSDEDIADGVLSAEIIEEREGVPYINENALKSGGEPNLNPDFKSLVDSIMEPADLLFPKAALQS